MPEGIVGSERIRYWIVYGSHQNREISPRFGMVSRDSTIADLHYTLQIAMGWDDFHLHQFIIRGKRYGGPRTNIRVTRGNFSVTGCSGFMIDS